MKITELIVKDVRFPTSLECDGSDAMHSDPDYSCAYVTIKTDTRHVGHGLTFTLGKGTEIVCCAVEAYRPLVLGRDVHAIYDNFSGFWRDITQNSQMRWLGPMKGVIHLAAASIINALWDLWARIEGKPLWKLLVDMDPEKLVSTIDFTYIEDSLTKQEAIAILQEGKVGQADREAEILKNGFTAYTTSAGWLGYDDDKIRKAPDMQNSYHPVLHIDPDMSQHIIIIKHASKLGFCLTYLSQLCQEALDDGFSGFKVKVGLNLSDDIRRLKMVRDCIGPEKKLMVDANQCWGVQTAIDWMKQLAQYNILWIEEPTSPDDILGHGYVSRCLAPDGIGVATGECCQNCVMFKQFLQSGAMQFCQIDSCRLAGPNEIMAVILMAAKYKVPVCPHAGGVGLCELVQHLSIWDYVSVSKSKENRMTEFVNHLHEHFVDPVVVKAGCYLAPQMPGYSIQMKESSVQDYEYPNGRMWKELLTSGRYTGTMKQTT